MAAGMRDHDPDGGRSTRPNVTATAPCKTCGQSAPVVCGACGSALHTAASVNADLLAALQGWAHEFRHHEPGMAYTRLLEATRAALLRAEGEAP